MRTKSFSAKRLLSLVLTIAMFATMILPTSVFALETNPGTVSSDLNEKSIVIGQAVEFTVAGEPVDAAGVMVKGKYEINSDTAVEKLEYYETATEYEGWHEFPSTVSGEFGPATGFPFSPLTSKFRVTFAEAGTYEVKVSIVTVDGGYEVCSETDTITVYGYADYSELETAISAGEAFESVKDDYTAASYQDLVDAIEAAKNVDDNLYATSQSVIDDAKDAINDAIDELVLRTDISFMAVAVAEDAKVDYAKADEIVLVFSKPIKNTGDVFTKLDDATKAAIDDADGIEWVSETVCKLTLKDNHTLANNHEVVLAPNDEIFTTLNEPVKGAKANVAGNLTEAYQQVTATSMAATIVKASAKPGVVAGDKIVLVFNAPVKENGDITVSGMTAKAIDTYKTVYEITLVDNQKIGEDKITDSTKLTYGSIENVALNGTFGTAEAPVILAAIAVDNNGNALTKDDEVVIYFNKPTNGTEVNADVIVEGAVSAEWNDAKTQLTVTLGEGANVAETMSINLGGLGIADEYGIAEYVAADITLKGAFVMPIAPVVYEILAVDNNGNAILEDDQIVIYFDRPTNKVDISDKLSTLANGAFGNYSEAEWNAAQTILTITLGKDATVTNGMLINLGGLGIRDYYNLVEYVAKDIKLDGAFVTSTAPVVTNVLAVDNNGNATTNGDNIVVTFDRPTNGINLDSPALSGIVKNVSYGLGTDYTAKWNNAKTELTITIGELATLIDGLTINLGNLGIKDAQETIDYVGTDIKIEGSFGTTVSPKITRAIAFTQNNKHVIRVFFNTEVTVSGSMSVYVENFDDDNATGKWTHNGISYYDMTLGENHDAFVTDHFSIKFEGTLLDTETLKSSIVDANAIIKGGFEQDIKPEILSLTAYSNDGSGIAKAGDKIILVFNSAVTSVTTAGKVFTTSDNVTWTYEIKENNEVKVGENIKFTVKALGNTEEMEAVIGGSFGYKAKLEMLSATAYNPSGTGISKGGEIIVAFNVPVTGITSTLGTVTKYDVDGHIWKISLYDNAIVNIGQGMEFHVTSAITGESQVVSKELTGSFGHYVEPKVIKATAYSKDGSGIAKENDTVIVTFNTPVTDVTVDPAIGVIENITTDDNVNYVITLGANPTVVVGNELDFAATSVITGETKTIENIKLGGSFGYKITPEVVSATAYSNDGSGIAKENDVIVVVFNTPVNVTVPAAFGTAMKADTYGNVWKITLAANSGAEIGKNLSISATSVATSEKVNLTPELGGSFGTVVEPALLSATAYSNDGSGIAKVGDKIVLVFNAPVSGVASTLGTVTDVKDSTVWEITLTNTDVEIEDELTFNVTALANSTTKEVKANLGGSLGKVVIPSIKSVTAISNDGSGVAKVGDRIIVVFDAAVRVGATDAEATYVYTYTLNATDITNGTYAIGNDYSVDVWSVATGAKYTLSGTVGGSYGYSEAPAVKSVVLTESELKEIITVVFDQATTKNDINTSKLYEKNSHLGQTVTAVWTSETVLKITLANDANTTVNSKLDTLDLGIKSKATNVDVVGINELAITGSLVPVATDVRFEGKTIKITFSARTNGVANISNLTALLGTGSTAAWDTYNRVLTITLGENYTITNNGYIVLNGMGIYNGFSGEYHVVGQYKVLGSIESDKLTVEKIVAQSTDKSKTTAQKGDSIVVKFNSTTDLKGGTLNQILDSAKVDEIITIDGGNEAALGTGYTGEWTSYDTLVITLGGSTTVPGVDGAEPTVTGNDPAITVGTDITVENVKFANGEGLMDAETIALSGSFNGREFILSDGAITRTGANNTGDYRIAVKAEDTLLAPSVVPTIVCVAYNGTNPVSVMRICVDVENTIQPVFEFAEGLKITSAKIYVFNELFGDVNSSPSVLAETLEVK